MEPFRSVVRSSSWECRRGRSMAKVKYRLNDPRRQPRIVQAVFHLGHGSPPSTFPGTRTDDRPERFHFARPESQATGTFHPGASLTSHVQGSIDLESF